MEIRPATAADIPGIVAIYGPSSATGTASFELTPPDAAEMLRRFESITAQGFPYVAAEIDGAIAGYAYASSYRSRPAYRFTVENSIYVAPGYQGRKVGTASLGA